MDQKWIGRKQIQSILGARKPSAYIQRAYLHFKKNRKYPSWARHSSKGVWEFRMDFVESDAEKNKVSIEVSEAARILNTSRRTIQNWIDAKDIALIRSSRHRGETRLIDRKKFMNEVDYYRSKLNKEPSVVKQPLVSCVEPKTKSYTKPLQIVKKPVIVVQKKINQNSVPKVKAATTSDILKDNIDIDKLDKKMVNEARAAAQRISDGVYDGHLTKSRARGIYLSITQKLGLENDAAEIIFREFVRR